MVQGVQYANVDFNNINVGKSISFKKEPTNKYDINAIQIFQDSNFLGYVPKNNIQSMIHDYINLDGRDIEGFINEIDEERNIIKIAIGFYKEISDEDLVKIPHVDASLTKTSKKDEFGTSRQDNLATANEGEEIEVSYQYDTDTYLVTLYGEELGEIGAGKTEKILEFENNGFELTGLIQELGYNDSGKITCKVRVFCIGEI